MALPLESISEGFTDSVVWRKNYLFGLSVHSFFHPGRSCYHDISSFFSRMAWAISM